MIAMLPARQRAALGRATAFRPVHCVCPFATAFHRTAARSRAPQRAPMIARAFAVCTASFSAARSNAP